MVNARLCETARQAVFFASPRHFNFLYCAGDRDFQVFRVRARGVQTLKIGAPDLVESYEKLRMSL